MLPTSPATPPFGGPTHASKASRMGAKLHLSLAASLLLLSLWPGYVLARPCAVSLVLLNKSSCLPPPLQQKSVTLATSKSVKLTVQNQLQGTSMTDKAISIWWVDYSGSVKRYAYICHGDSFSVNTYRGHLWVVQGYSSATQCMSVITAGIAPAQTMVITE